MNLYLLVSLVCTALLGSVVYVTRPKAPLQQANMNVPDVQTPVPAVPIETASTTPPVPLQAPTTNQQRLYAVAAASLGKIMKLDSSVPNLYACASSLSGVLVKAGFEELPAKGFANTNDLCNFFLAHPEWFQRISQPSPGDIIMFPSPVSPQPNQLDHGHTGVMAAVDQGVMSNDSDTGLWREIWKLPAMLDYYVTYGRLTAFYFRYLG